MSTTIDPIGRDPDLLEGQAAFAGTRVPVWMLFSYLVEGASLDEFLAIYPQVDRAAAQTALERACQALTGQPSSGD